MQLSVVDEAIAMIKAVLAADAVVDPVPPFAIGIVSPVGISFKIPSAETNGLRSAIIEPYAKVIGAAPSKLISVAEIATPIL